MKNLSTFQIVLLSISALIIVGGVIMFSFAQNVANREAGLVTVWGTLSEENFEQLENYLKEVKEIKQTIEYRSIDPEDFDDELTTALAEGGGPDVFFITDEKLIRHQNKLLKIDYEFYPERLFKDTFVEAGELFADETGIYAFPFLIDPMVMYWNRSLFTEMGESQPPRYWDQLLTLVPDLTQKDSNLALIKSAMAMGDYQNVSHAKQIITTLFMQAGNDIVIKNPIQEVEEARQSGLDTNPYDVIFDDKLDFTVAPAQAAVNFYTQFANPARSVYTWNRSLANSLDAFIAGDVAIYFGFASEFSLVRQKNPNLNFDVAVIPQSRSGGFTTYGNVLALAIPKNSVNLERSYPFIQSIIEPDTISVISDILFLPPVRRDLLAGDPENAFMQTFHDSALISQNIYDFDPEELDEIFRRMVESVVTGRLNTSEAVNRANGEIEVLVKGEN